MPTTVGIAGLTGKFAQCVAKALLAYNDVTIRGYCRNPKKLPQSIISESNIDVTRGEYDDRDAARRFVRGSDVVICCYFGDAELMTEGQKVLIDACEDEGVPRYVASDFAVDYTKIPVGALFPKESARAIKEYLQTKRVKGVHILTGALMETFWSEYFGLWKPDDVSIAFWGSGNEKWELTTYATAAAYTAAVSLDENAIGVLRFVGDRKSVFEIREIFEDAYDIHLHLQRRGSVEDLYKSVHDAFDEKPADLAAWAPRCFEFWCICGNAYLETDLDNGRYPHIQPVALKTFLQSHSVEGLHRADQALGF